jgi:hypothetical protein
MRGRMVHILPVLGVALGMFLFLGTAVWVWLPSTWTRCTLPAVPLLGAMALAVGLHLTGIILGVRQGLVVLLLAAALGLALRTRRTRWWTHLDGVRWLLLGLATGALYTWVLLAPARPLGLTLVEPGGSNDGFAYISNAAWLIDHPILDPPAFTAAPVWVYTNLVLNDGIRVGEELNHAAVAAATGNDPVGTWYVVSCLWVALLPGGLIAVTAMLRLPRYLGVVAGMLVAGSSVVLSQEIYSFTAGLLGLAMAPLALALVWRYVEDAGCAHGDPPPVWLAAGALTAWVSTYTEYLPIVAVGLVAIAVVHSPAVLRAKLAVTAQLLGALAIIGPLAWYRALRSLFVTTATFQIPGAASPFLGVPLHTAASHYVGTLGLLESGGSRSSYVMVALIAVGAACELILSPSRRFFILFLGSSALVVTVLSTVHYYPYAQGRALAITFPLVMLAMVTGYAELARRAAARARSRAIPNAVIAVAAVAVAFFLIVNYETVTPYLAPFPHQYAAAHVYDATEFNAARSWLTSVAGPRGANGMVIETQAFERSWLQYALRDLTDLSYQTTIPRFRRSTTASGTNFGPSRRYAVVERGVFMDTDPRVVVGHAGSFQFLDLSRGHVIIGVGTIQFNALTNEGARFVEWMADDGDLWITHDPGSTHVVISLEPVPQLAPVTVDITAQGIPTQYVTLTAGITDVTIALPPEQTVAIHLHNVQDAVVTGGDAALRSIALIAVHAQ